MIFRTELHIPPANFNIQHDQLIWLIGSCFSQNIGERLQKYKFKSISNPLGTTFHPVAISKLLLYITENSKISIDELILSQGIYVHPDFHSCMGDIDANVALQKINTTINEMHTYLKDVKYLFITLGTSIGYRQKSTGELVANCHKLPLNLFSKEDTSVEECAGFLTDALEKILVTHEHIKIILTVSPVRHIKDGIIENTRSKAKLIQCVDILTKKNDHCSYFPAYEWMMDDLRDYRYYDRDLIHPNEMAIDYLWEKFSNHYFDIQTREINQNIEKLNKKMAHRPFNPASVEYQQFVQNLAKEIDEMEKTYSWLKF